jgi:hypothetical protein
MASAWVQVWRAAGICEPLTQHLRHVREALSRPEFRDAVRAQQLMEEVETFCQEAIVNDLPG